METMQVAVFTGVNEVGLETHKRPSAVGKKVLVKIDACALCTWEQRVYTGIKNVNYPFIGGHEIAGRIVEIGDDVDAREW